MLPIFWLASADADVASIIEYIGQHDVLAAEHMWIGSPHRVSRSSMWFMHASNTRWSGHSGWLV